MVSEYAETSEVTWDDPVPYCGGNAEVDGIEIWGSTGDKEYVLAIFDWPDTPSVHWEVGPFDKGIGDKISLGEGSEPTVEEAKASAAAFVTYVYANPSEFDGTREEN